MRLCLKVEINNSTLKGTSLTTQVQVTTNNIKDYKTAAFIKAIYNFGFK